jgi:trafficking protein particle complex subunit 8
VVDRCIISEKFWVDLVLRNPLDSEVNLSNLTVVVEVSQAAYADPPDTFVELEIISDVILGARETRTV